MAKKSIGRLPLLAVVVWVALASVGCVSWPEYAIKVGVIQDINGDIETGTLSLIKLPAVYDTGRSGESPEQIRIIKASRGGEIIYAFLTAYPRHQLIIKIDDLPPLYIESQEKDDEGYTLPTDFFAGDSEGILMKGIVALLKNCKTLVLQTETIDYKSKIMTVEPGAIEALHKLLE